MNSLVNFCPPILHAFHVQARLEALFDANLTHILPSDHVPAANVR